MLSAPESPHKARAVGYISEVSLSFKFKGKKNRKTGICDPQKIGKK